MAEGGAGAVDLMPLRLAWHLERGLGEAQHARPAERAAAVPQNRLWIKGVPRNIPENGMRAAPLREPPWPWMRARVFTDLDAGRDSVAFTPPEGLP